MQRKERKWRGRKKIGRRLNRLERKRTKKKENLMRLLLRLGVSRHFVWCRFGFMLLFYCSSSDSSSALLSHWMNGLALARTSAATSLLTSQLDSGGASNHSMSVGSSSTSSS